MKDEYRLQFKCQQCDHPILFSVLESENFHSGIICSECGQQYAFDDETLQTHLKQFEALCKQLHASHDILGKTAVAIDVGSHHVKVPFNILLTRLSAVIELNVNGKSTQIAFRVEPLIDVPAASTAK